MTASSSFSPDQEAKVETFRSIFERALDDIQERTEASKRCIILSGGVDTCAILKAAKKLGMTFEAAFTVITKDDSPDKEFAIAAGRDFGFTMEEDNSSLKKHFMLKVTSDELLSNYLPTCVELLYTFDGMTLRNSLVIAAAFQKVASLGYTDVVVGDAADELFGGYSFMWGKEDDPAKWKEQRDSMCQSWTFATSTIGKKYGLTCHSPYMEPRTVDWALKNTFREDCIGMRPIRLVHEGERIDHTTGKLILRYAYDTVSSWRRKDPIEVGSGITIIGKDDYWSEILPDEEYDRAKSELAKRGFVIQTKEHLMNFRAFESKFGTYNGSISLPDEKRLELGKGCAGCCFDISSKTFCKICGAYPAQRQ